MTNLRDIIGSTLGTSKDQTLAGLVVHDLLKMLDEPITLVIVVDDFNDLLNVVIG